MLLLYLITNQTRTLVRWGNSLIRFRSLRLSWIRITQRHPQPTPLITFSILSSSAFLPLSAILLFFGLSFKINASQYYFNFHSVSFPKICINRRVPPPPRLRRTSSARQPCSFSLVSRTKETTQISLCRSKWQSFSPGYLLQKGLRTSPDQLTISI